MTYGQFRETRKFDVPNELKVHDVSPGGGTRCGKKAESRLKTLVTWTSKGPRRQTTCERCRW